MSGRLFAVSAILLALGACTAPSVSPVASPTGPPDHSAAPTASAPATPTRSPVATAGATATVSPTATPGSTPGASASVHPSATPTDGTLRVDEADITRHLDALAAVAQQHDGTRAAGTAGYDASADYVAGELAGLGFRVDRQSVDFTFFDEAAPVSLSVGGQTWTGSEWLHAMLYSAPGSAEALLGHVETVVEGRTACDAATWSGFTAGHIAIVDAGPCPRRTQVELAQQVGAVAFIGLYPTWAADQIKRPSLLDPAGIDIPVIAAGAEPTTALLAAAQSGMSARLQVEVDTSRRRVDNIVAELPGTGDSVVMVGGHLDSALDGPGIEDNGSGVAAVLAMADAAARLPQPQTTIRLAFWAAEEFGDLGSSDYVNHLSQAERGRIRAYLNLDMVGSPNPGRFVYDDQAAPAGSSDLTDRLLAALAAMNAPGVPLDVGPGSDHYAFELAGIPSGGVFSGLGAMTPNDAHLFGGQAGVAMDPCYHLACDGRDNVNLASTALLGQAVATVVEELAY